MTRAGDNSGNSRNGKSKKIITGKRGSVEIEVPRDRQAEFAPQLVKKGQRRFDGFDDKIISMYARGMSCRQIQAHLQEIYAVEVSPDLISTVTDGVIDEVRAWQSRPLDALYPILYLDALQVKIKSEGRVANKAIYLAIGVNLQGTKEVLGMWASENEGAKFWLGVVTELRNRGVRDIFIACVDGLKGFPEAIETVFPKTTVQLCLVHLVRYSLAYVSFKDRKALVANLKTIYRATSLEDAEAQLETFSATWDSRYPMIARSWRANWTRVIPMFTGFPTGLPRWGSLFGLPEGIRRAVYTTNAIESLNMSLRKIIKCRSSFPSEDAAFKLLYLALQNAAKKWTMPIPNWSQAMNQFAILYDGRLPMPGGDNSLTQFS